MNSTETIVTSNTATTEAEGDGYAATADVVTPAGKVPSKKSFATAIFKAKLVERAQSLFASNKEFRHAVIATIMSDLGVSLASASTMYNAAKSEAEAADGSVVIGRDPKKVIVKIGNGKRGRPAGSVNKKTATVTPDTVIINEVILNTKPNAIGVDDACGNEEVAA